MTRATRNVFVLLLLLFFVGLFAGCPSWAPAKEGKCNTGRQWVPPHEEGGKWMPGYCKDAL